ncbi:hypothetical protein BD626DRAFT_48348 [Schizophyllum amplum]|uniref:Chitin-binding type-4 domain-containing protein n=1 Tax=Schizophyllum amplum TaxID=97359 RepID=A0A550BSR5_9AGAR|nr:hypothetical protein BD626DRAFT_48348 [Auriculariopsis ampla]
MRSLIVVAALAAIARAHVGSFVKGMYCRNGGADYDEPNSNNEVKPIYDQNLENFMFNQAQNCLNDPPPEGEIADLPAGGVIDIELATNRGCTTFSFGGQYATKYIDGSTVDYPDDWNDPNCLTNPNLHAQNKSMAAGTALAISYVNDIHDVTFDNLVVFSVLPNTPWLYRQVQYEIPAGMPPCPNDVCICAWLWVPNGCGTPNEYMDGFKCRVTNATGTNQLGAPQPPVYCGEDAAPYETSVPACIQGPKKMIVWGQDPSINNVVVPANSGVSPGYNERSGFEPGAQNDIFTGGDITW